ncbi:MAG: ATP-binding protein [Nitrospirota bacterium]
MIQTMTLVVPSHPRYLCVIRSALQPLLLDEGFSEKEARTIVLAIDEACSNIIKYAYEQDSSKTIAMTLHFGGETLTVELKDTGKKPDLAKITPRKLDEIRPGGLGTHFISSVFDTVTYDTSGAEGTLLTLIKLKPAAEPGRLPHET